ncbi:hypothetical protein [Flavobacterium sp. CS20]|uniref:hypothetical protein n=1 Tax=Flavobacterium sp. CS20 TaxID=2775246 RepID=UPI0035301ACB
MTAPIGGHLLGRTGYFTGNKLCDQTHIDDLKDQYNKKTHKLSSEDQKLSEEKDTPHK